MDRRHVLALSGALFAGALAGCTADEETADETGGDEPPEDHAAGTEPDIDDEDLAELVGETNGFAFDLYRELLDDHSEENLFASPVSISLALAMAYAGARGETREQMRETLRYTLADEKVHGAFEELQRRLDERSEDVDETGGAYDEDDDPVPFELSIANSVWGQEAYPFEDEYLTTLETYYGGGLREVDYQSDAESAREQINDWVADETEDRLEELLPQGSLDELTRLVLVNAVYFLANWKHPFTEGLTSEAQFNALDGSEQTVQMMQKQRRWPYAEVDGAQAVELPYVGGETSMLVILPPEGEFESYEQSFDGEQLETIVEALDSREGTVGLPRFEFESGFALGSVLESMGMADAFDAQNADFSGIVDQEETDEDLFIHEVFHDTFVAVDEEGTEAAAATGVVISEESEPADPFEFVADRPFLFAIRDRQTSTILFVGRAVDPAGWE